MLYISPKLYMRVLCRDVDRPQLSWKDLQFVTSDSIAYKARAFFRSILKLLWFSNNMYTWRAGSNDGNTYRVDRAVTNVCQALDLLKVDGAGHTEGLSGTDNMTRSNAGLRVYQGYRRSI